MAGRRSYTTDTGFRHPITLMHAFPRVQATSSSPDTRSQHNSLTNRMTHLTLENQLNEFMTATTLTAHEIQQRESLIRDLENVLVQSSCTLYPVGSFYTGLCGGHSDLDIFADTTGAGGIYEVRRFLGQASHLFSRVNQITARIPLINFVHVKTGIQVDLSFGGVENNGRMKSGLIDTYLNLKPRIFRPLFSLIRYWSKFNGLAGAKELKNYALSLLILVFLTRKELIDSVQKMAQNYSFLRDFGYKKTKSPSTAQIQLFQLSFAETIEILQLAQEFFTTFAELDYNKFVICCLTSEWIPKEIFRHVDNFGSIIPQTGSYIYNEWMSSKRSGVVRLNYESPLCIQDPFDLRTNVTYTVTSTLLYKFKTACGNTAPKIQTILNSPRAQNPSVRLMSIFS